jgi:hypothetical protein
MVAEGSIPPSSESGRGVEAPPIGDVSKNIGAAWTAAELYLATQAKRLRLAFRTFLLAVLFTCVAAVFGVSIVISASVLLMMGVADGLASMLGGRQWAGDLITGVAVVLTVIIAGYVLVSKMMRSARSRTMSGYEKPTMRN